MTTPLRVLVAGCGNMGASHARAYHKMPEFEIVGLVSRGAASREALSKELGGLPRVQRLLRGARRDQARRRQHQHLSRNACAVRQGGHRGRLPRLLREAAGRNRRGGAGDRRCRARGNGRKLVIGYILRVHPAWIRFIEIARTLGKPLVMRMNLNQQSHGPTWDVAPQPDEVDEPDRRLRRPLRRRDVPDDRRASRCACRPSARG